jgi:flagellar protein FliO/FliZ
MPLAAQAGPSPSAQAALPDEASLGIQDAAGQGAAAKGPAGTGIWPFVQMLVILGLVALAIYGVVALLLKARRGPKSSLPPVALLASTTLAPGRAVHVVKAGGRGFLLGSGESSVSLIAEIDDKEYLDGLELEAQKAPKAGRGFAALLESVLGGRGRAGHRGGGDQMDFLSRQRERLNRLK